MNATAITQGLEIAGLLFRLIAAAAARSDNETVGRITRAGEKIVAGVQTSGRIDTAVAAEIRAMADTLDAEGEPTRAEWEALAGKVRDAADRWNKAG